MKFSIKRQKLLASIQEVSNAISPRAAVIPILTGMKLNMNNDALALIYQLSNSIPFPLPLLLSLCINLYLSFLPYPPNCIIIIFLHNLPQY